MRSSLINAQPMNDLLGKPLADYDAYLALFDDASPHPQRDVIEGMRYARNVVQHVMHTVRK